MAEIKVLIEGYAKDTGNGWLASSSVVLVRSGGKTIVTDPGCNRERLLQALKKEGLRPGDVDFVFLSHGHVDHALLAGIFDRAKFVTFESLMYDKDRQLEFDERVMGPDTQVIKTPGHAHEHCSLVISTDDGVYVVAGDVFWWADGEKQKVDVNKEDLAHPDELDMKKLIESRKRILDIADWVVPGHGKVFKVGKRS